MAAASASAVSKLLAAQPGLNRSESHATRVKGWHDITPGFTVQREVRFEAADGYRGTPTGEVRIGWQHSLMPSTSMTTAQRATRLQARLDMMDEVLRAAGYVVEQRQDVPRYGFASDPYLLASRPDKPAARPASAATVRATPAVTRTCKATGARVTVTTAELAGLDPEGGPWITLCEDHGSVCNHATRALRDQHARDSSEWCEGCRA